MTAQTQQRPSSQSASFTPYEINLLFLLSFIIIIIKRSNWAGGKGRRIGCVFGESTLSKWICDVSREITPLTSWGCFYYLSWINKLLSLSTLTTTGQPFFFFQRATTFINRLIRMVVRVRITCSSVTDTEWMVVLAHRGGDLHEAHMKGSLSLCWAHKYAFHYWLQTEITPRCRLLGSRPPQLSSDLQRHSWNPRLGFKASPLNTFVLLIFIGKSSDDIQENIWNKDKINHKVKAT